MVAAWQAGALSRDTMFELFQRGEILPDGRTNQDEAELVRAGRANIPKAQNRGAEGRPIRSGCASVPLLLRE